MQQYPDLSQLVQLAQSPAGRQFLDFLQKNGGYSLQNALSQASAGNYEDAKAALRTLLQTPEAKVLLSQLEEQI